MNNGKNISSEELLDELVDRIKAGEIKISAQYLYDTEEYRIRFLTSYNSQGFRIDWDVKKSARYRENYENYCLPLINRQKEKKYDKELELLKENIKQLKT